MKRKLILFAVFLAFSAGLFACALNQDNSAVSSSALSTATVVTKPATVDEITTVETTKLTDATTKVTLPATTVTENEAVTKKATEKSENTNKPTAKPTVKPTLKPESTDDEARDYKYIAFTFDDGPHYELTYKFVDKLAEYGGKGTFFFVGNRINSVCAEAVKYAYEMGNEVAVHGYTHEVYYDDCSDKRFKSELSKTADAIKSATGYTPTLMRPIGGLITDERIANCGYDVILWNVDSQDWQYWDRSDEAAQKKNVNSIYKNIMKSTDENDIILLHEIYYNSFDAFSKAIDKLYKEGYRFVTVSELLGRSEDSRNNLYYSAD